MRLKNSHIIIVIILFLVIGLVFFIPQKIEKEYSGIQYRIGNEVYEEKILIHMNGYIRRGLFLYQYPYLSQLTKSKGRRVGLQKMV